MPIIQNTKDWKERFEEAIRPFSKDMDLYLVPNIDNSAKCWMMERKTDEIKSFIETELTLAKKEAVEEIKGKIEKMNTYQDISPHGKEIGPPYIYKADLLAQLNSKDD